MIPRNRQRKTEEGKIAAQGRGDGDTGPNFKPSLSVSRGTQNRPTDGETVVCCSPIGGDRNPLVPHQPIESID